MWLNWPRLELKYCLQSSPCLNLKFSNLRRELDVIIELLNDYISCSRKTRLWYKQTRSRSPFTAEASWSRKRASVCTLGLTEHAFTHTWAVRGAGRGAASAQVWAELKLAVSLDPRVFQHSFWGQTRDIFVPLCGLCRAGWDLFFLDCLFQICVWAFYTAAFWGTFIWRVFSPPVFSQKLVSWATAMLQCWGLVQRAHQTCFCIHMLSEEVLAVYVSVWYWGISIISNLLSFPSLPLSYLSSLPFLLSHAGFFISFCPVWFVPSSLAVVVFCLIYRRLPVRTSFPQRATKALAVLGLVLVQVALVKNRHFTLKGKLY